MRGIQRQIIDVPLAVGLSEKSDPRALEVGALSVCENAEFDELGGLQTRKPFVKFLDQAGNAVTPIRKLAVYDDELVAFTDVAIFSYAKSTQTWTQRAEYLAPKLTEKTRFVDNAEQYDCDRVELNGVVVFAWVQNIAGTELSHIAGLDAATGAVLLGPAAFGATSQLLRLAATTNRIAAVYKIATPAIRVRLYDPADLSSTTVVDHAVGSAIVSLDVVAKGASLAVVAQLTSGTSYEVAVTDETPTVTASATKARTCDGPISIDVDADGAYAISRVNGTAIEGDFLTSALADNGVSIALGTATGATVNQLTVKYRSVQDSSQYRAYSLWSSDEGTSGGLANFTLEYNWCSDPVTLGTKAVLVRRAGVASHAFDHDGKICVWVAFGASSISGALTAQVQNSYFLYRDDGLIIAKAATNVGGGHANTEGHLPGVQALGSNIYAWCGVERGVMALGQGQKGYSAKSPREIVLELDSNEARRATQMGRTLYITGGMIAQYDGQSCVEVGFHVHPTEISFVFQNAGTRTGETYFRQTAGWFNAKGELDEGTTATFYPQTASSHLDAYFSLVYGIHITAKTGAAGEAFAQLWRNEVAGGPGAPFYLVTSPDPSSTGDNSYIENDPTAASIASAYVDSLTDAELISKRIDPETGGLLENLAPPPATILAATQDRLFLAGISDAPHRVAYSKTRSEGTIAAFHEALAFDVPAVGGPITALAFLNETLIVFKQTAIYAVTGDGYDNAGGGQNYGPARLLSIDVGATSHDLIALTPKGLLFHSSKGWYLLNHGWSAGYVGAPVSTFDDDSFLSVHVMDAQHQVRCVSTSRILVWDYLVNQWVVWSTADAPLSSVIWGGVQHYAYAYRTTTDQVRSQRADWDENVDPYGLDIETPWIKLSGLQAFQSVRRLLLLGEYRSPSSVRIRVAYNYEETEEDGITWLDDKTWTVDPTAVGGPMQLRHTPMRRKCQAIKIRITARDAAKTDAPLGEAFKLTGLSLEIGIKPGAARHLPAAQKQ